jgi:transposase
LTKQQASAGPKRHTALDSFGKRAVVVTAASVPEGQASKQVLSFGLPDGTRVPRLYLIGVDRGDSGDRFLKSVMDSLGWIIQVVLPPQQIQCLVLRKKRSVVEQSFSWLN